MKCNHLTNDYRIYAAKRKYVTSPHMFGLDGRYGVSVNFDLAFCFCNVKQMLELPEVPYSVSL
jgi:hypothetical protein